MASSLVVVVSDEHINSTVSLLVPTVALDDGGTYHSSRSQRWLWENWLDFWQYVKEKAAGRKVVAINNGDLGELDTKRRSNQLITPNKATILAMTLETLRPAMDVVHSWIIMRGTTAHEGKSGWLEEAIADDLDNSIPYDKKTKSWWQFWGEISDTTFDIAHHASMSGVPYTRATSASRLASATAWYYKVLRDQKPPDIVVRSHNHFFGDSGKNLPCRVFYTPCWSMQTEYVYRIGRENEIPDVGGLIFECEEGNGYKWELRRYKYNNRKIYKLKM